MKLLTQYETSLCTGGMSYSFTSADNAILVATGIFLFLCASWFYAYGDNYEVSGFALNGSGSISPVISIKQ